MKVEKRAYSKSITFPLLSKDLNPLEVDWTSKVQSDIPRAVAKPTTLVVGLL